MANSQSVQITADGPDLQTIQRLQTTRSRSRLDAELDGFIYKLWNSVSLTMAMEANHAVVQIGCDRPANPPGAPSSSMTQGLSPRISRRIVAVTLRCTSSGIGVSGRYRPLRCVCIGLPGALTHDSALLSRRSNATSRSIGTVSSFSARAGSCCSVSLIVRFSIRADTGNSAS